MMLGRDAVDGYVWLYEPSLNLGSSTVSRVVTDEPDPTFVRRPVGFLAPLHPEPDPQTWEGDNA